jgi:Zn-dependent M28 family amino/carboxypeptidase
MKSLSQFAFLFLLIGLIFSGCEPADTQRTSKAEISVDRDQLLQDVRTLSSDEFEGRKTGTEGNRMAQDFIVERFVRLGVQPVAGDFQHLFDHVNPRNNNAFKDAVNLIGMIEGTKNPDRFIAVTAHYDHLGKNDEIIFNGADDNASGVGGLLAAAKWFSSNPPENSILLIAFDAEEQGLGGARHFVENPPVPLESIVMNINMDMISLSESDELYAVGTYHYPFLKPMVEEATKGTSISILFGHDSPDLPPGDDWTMSSDHGPFHQKGIPFIYFGVEDHPFYHTPADVYENITKDFYVESVRTIIQAISYFDKNLDKVADASER